MKQEIPFLVQIILGTLVSFFTFLAFPIIQFLFLRTVSKKRGKIKFLYSPEIGFTIFVKNMREKWTFSELKYQTKLRKLVNIDNQKVVDKILVDNKQFFLFPGCDEILLNFKIVGSSSSHLEFIQTDVQGNSIGINSFDDFEKLLCDFTSTINNKLNLNFRASKRIVVYKDSLIKHWHTIQMNNVRQEFQIDEIIEIN